MQLFTSDGDGNCYRKGFNSESFEEELYMGAKNSTAVLGMLTPIVEHYGFVLDVQAHSEGTGQIFGVPAFVVDGGEALPLAECLGEGCVHSACS